MKSGTTLLRALLGQHPRLYAGFETHWFEEAIRSGWADPSSKRMELLLSLLEVSPREYTILCDRKRNAPEREFIDIVLEYCCHREGKQRWIEKTPDNIRYWGLIQELWEESTLIHVTREYKDVYTSWKIRRGDSLSTFLCAAKSAYDEIRPLLGQTKTNYVEVDYLDLVCHPEDTMRRVLQHIGEDWASDCGALDVHRTQAERTMFKELLGRESWTLVSLSRPIFKNSIGQWQDHLTVKERDRIEAELAEFYEIYGDKWREVTA